MAGLFDTFSIAKKGLSVAQSQINTTSHNIANVDTTGYTRQRAVATTTTPSGGNSKFDNCTVGQVGTGSQISSIERIRDSFDDYQVRSETTTNSALDTQNTYLEEANNVFTDTSSSGLSTTLADFYSSFQTLATSPETDSNKTVAVAKAATLASNITDRYSQLESETTELQDTLKTNVTEMNSTLDKINNLNKSIENVTSLGLTPNDLMDTRDNLLDDLSAKLGVTVTSEKDNGINVSTTEMTSVGNLVNSKDTTGASCARFSSVENVAVSGTSVTVTYSKLGDSSNKGTITVNAASSTDAADLKASLEKCRVLVANSTGTVSATTESSLKSAMFQVTGGEVGGNQTVQGDITKTMGQLDNLASALAYTVNAIQTGSTDGTTNTNLANQDLIFVTSSSDGTTSPTDTGINASNITINSALQDEPTLLNCGTTATSGEKSGTRAQAIADIASLDIDFSNSNVTSSTTRANFFTNTGLTFKDSTTNLDLKSSSTGSTLDDYYTSLVGTLASTGNEVSSNLTTSKTLLTAAQNQRTSISGVSLDEETTNLIEYQHAYQANAKVISTIDSLLDVVINGLMS